MFLSFFLCALSILSSILYTICSICNSSQQHLATNERLFATDSCFCIRIVKAQKLSRWGLKIKGKLYHGRWRISLKPHHHLNLDILKTLDNRALRIKRHRSFQSPLTSSKDGTWTRQMSLRVAFASCLGPVISGAWDSWQDLQFCNG